MSFSTRSQSRPEPLSDMLTLDERAGATAIAGAPALELDDIQAMIIRERPEPYFGTHVLLRVDEPRAGREFLRRLKPHVDSASQTTGETWLGVWMTYTGLEALRLPEESLQSFPETFRVGILPRKHAISLAVTDVIAGTTSYL